MGRHGMWSENDHPRDDHGRFGHGNGGDAHSPSNSRGDGRSSGSGNDRGMPDAIATADVPVRGGDELALDYHPDGSLTASTSDSSVRLPSEAVSDFLHGLNGIGSEETADGDETWIKTIGRDADGRPTGVNLAALISKDGDNKYSLRLATSGSPSVEDLRNVPAVRLNDKDLGNIEDQAFRMESASRIDTGNGDVDISISDDKKFSIRHIGDDGRPLETKLNPKSFAKLNHAVNSVIDGWDEEDPTLADDEVVTQRTVKTNAGNVNVQLFGEWGGSNSGDRIEITAEDDSWGIVVNGPHQSDFADAISTVEQAGEALEIYDPYAR